MTRTDPAASQRLLQGGWQLCPVPPGAPFPGDEADWLPAQVPGTAASSWRAAGRWSLDAAEPPTRRFDADDWCWRLRFDCDDLAGAAGWQLGFDGLATLAEVWLNGERVLTSSNMFERHVCEVSALLRARGNVLEIRCRALDAELAAKRPRPRWKAPLVENGQLRWFRTTLLGRVPGWTPPAAAVGPWRAVWLQPQPAVAVQAPLWQADFDGQAGAVDFRASLVLAPGRAARTVELACARAGVRHSVRLDLDSQARLSGRLRVPQAQPWWPHTHGEPALYDLQLIVQIEGEATPRTLRLGRAGFRRIELDREGGAFALRVNGEPVFCRGACWMPLDPVRLHDEPAALQHAVQQVREAGMNMLRVAGPTVYEQAAFYDACDEHGVLVWQDFMFANMDYPWPADDAAADDPARALAASIEREVRQQAQALAPHACLAVWCGNSEQEHQAAMWGVAPELQRPALFHRHIPAWCAEVAPWVPYWPSSAHGGDFPFRPDTGTCSYYGVGAYLLPLDDALASGVRFATECLAVANVPPEATLARARRDVGEHPYQSRFRAAERDFHAVRDHYFAQLTGESAEAARVRDEARFLATSRWVSAHVMAETFLRWRSTRSTCAGGLVWFLKDLQPGAGWGLLDDQGRPKAAWYGLRRALQPTAIALLDKGMNGVDVEWAHDGPAAREVTLRVQGWHAGGARIVDVTQPLTLAPRSRGALPMARLLGAFMDLGHAYRFGPPPCDVLVAQLLDADGACVAEHTFLPQALRGPLLPSVGWQVRLQRQGQAWALTVQAAACVVGVHLGCGDLVPEDEWFTLLPGEARTIGLRPLHGPAGAEPPVVEVAALNTLERATAQMA